MFPYPSGNLHMGHVRVYTISDSIARFERARGKEVLHPMGWDAFGLPAENAAMERNISAAAWTEKNIDFMKGQLQSLGLSFDWDDCEVATCDPSYYKWTQWLFLQLHEAGMAYRKESVVNWDPVDCTVLANEQIDSEGRSWRSGALVEQRLLPQWFISITDYADELLDGLDELDGWPEQVKQMQRNWIGRSAGVTLGFKVNPTVTLDVFTTRVDTLFGVTFLAVSPDHHLVDEALSTSLSDADCAKIDAMRRAKIAKSTKVDTSGVSLGISAEHPLTGAEVPVFAAPYVVGDYGSGAVMGVPAHDDRDYEFARTNGARIERVIAPAQDGGSEVLPYTGDGILVGSGEYDGMDSADVREALAARLEDAGLGSSTVRYKLRDWLVSRQRFWGAPIPAVHCATCGTVPLDESSLPVKLPDPDVVDAQGEGTPLQRVPGWDSDCVCPSCGAEDGVLRDGDTLDTFVDSSWYFLRYTDARNTAEPFRRDAVDRWCPTDVYIGGIEHAILHLLYSRFIQRFLWHRGYVSHPEPFKELLTQGMVLAKTYKDPETGRYLKPEELDMTDESNPKFQSKIPSVGWEKMSKSKYNGVEPSAMISRYGADVTRLAILFMAPPEQDLEWDEFAVAGQARWVERVRKLVMWRPSATTMQEKDTVQAAKIRHAVHTAIMEVTRNVAETRSFNVAIACLMKLSNELAEAQNALGADADMLALSAVEEGCQALLIMLGPFAPQLSEELWSARFPDSPLLMNVRGQQWTRARSCRRKRSLSFKSKESASYRCMCRPRLCRTRRRWQMPQRRMTVFRHCSDPMSFLRSLPFLEIPKEAGSAREFRDLILFFFKPFIFVIKVLRAACWQPCAA